MKSIALQIDGMNCASCLRRVEKALLDSSGVVDASVNLVAETALFTMLQSVVNASGINQRTMHNIRINLLWNFDYNIFLVPLAAGTLFPVSGLILSPVLAAGAMALSSAFALPNALRLRWMKLALHEQNLPKPRIDSALSVTSAQ